MVPYRTPQGVTPAFILMVILVLCSTACSAKYAGGTGTAQDPYQIATAADLIALGEAPEDYDKHFILTADIDLDPNLPGGRVFDTALIARDTNQMKDSFDGSPFTGVFDGRFHSISHLTIAGKHYLGLFGYSGPGAVITSLKLADARIASASSYIGGYTGGLVGHNRGSVAHCSIEGSVNGVCVVGGLAGFNEGDVIDCHSHGVILAKDRTGGLLGWNTGTATDCFSTARVEGVQVAGGFAATNSGVLTRCCYIGTVNGVTVAGGLVGYDFGGTIVDCYNSGAVSGDGGVGGLVGTMSAGSLTRCYSYGPVSGGGSTGGLMGSNWKSDVIGCFWDTQTSDQPTSAGGMGLTSAQMKTASTFLNAGWDFAGETANGTENVWWIEEGKGYPRLSWELNELGSLSVIQLDVGSFDTGIAQGVVLVDFYATWCSHCTTQDPILHEVAARIQDWARVAKLDVAKAKGIMQQYGVSGVPTLIVFRDGLETSRFVGVTSADALIAAIQSALESPGQACR